MTQILILTATFFSILIASFGFISFISSRKKTSDRMGDADLSDGISFDGIGDDISGLPITEKELIKNYFVVIRNDNNPNSMQNRLIKAGYFSPEAVWIFQVFRFFVAFVVFLSVYLLLPQFLPETPQLTLVLVASIVSTFLFFICNLLLERQGVKREREYRKTFPDFMDTLIVCLDAGLSVEAAFNRVSKEFLDSSRKEFGLHLAIMMLEVRGGRRLRDSLSNFAKRLRIDEARALAVLFRQSEELGASVTKTLRVFSQDMRDKRIIRAEEKANALPLKMLFPLAVFLFPMSLLIVLVPITMSVIKTLSTLVS